MNFKKIYLPNVNIDHKKDYKHKKNTDARSRSYMGGAHIFLMDGPWKEKIR